MHALCCLRCAQAALFRPRLIIAGASAYSRNIDYKRMRKVRGGRRRGARLMHGVRRVGGEERSLKDVPLTLLLLPARHLPASHRATPGFAR